MSIITLFAFLVGNRNAIRTLAAHPRAWIVGLIFVLSAGFAREYDGEDLLHEPWHLLTPFGASLVASFLLFTVLFGFSILSRKGHLYFTRYRSFLTLFWLTAPLAWLYAIPYERFLDPLEATQANLATLAVVATWRVALMIRVGVVLTGLSPAAAFFRVLAYADAMVLLGLYLLPFPLIEFMGGTRLREADREVREAASSVVCFAIPLLPLLFLAACLAPGRSRWQLKTGNNAAPRPIGWPMWILAFLSLAVWVPVLPFTQPEQQLRHELDVAFREGRLDDMLALMSANELDNFPPHWEPPPRFLKGEWEARNLDIWEEILRVSPAAWVRATYLQKLKDYVAITHFTRIDLEKLSSLLNRMPEAEALDVIESMMPADYGLRERLNLRPELKARLKDPSP